MQDVRAQIVQKGAVPPLIQMLKTQESSLQEMAAFALGRLAQGGGEKSPEFLAMGTVPPLLDLLDSGVETLEHNAAFALFSLANNNAENATEMMKCGALERLQAAAKSMLPNDPHTNQATLDCIKKAVKCIEVCSPLT